MSDHSEAFIAFDTSKLRNAVAIADAGRSGEVRFVGEIENSGTATAKLVRKLATKYERLTFCYEAGPTGYGLYRQIKSLGHECVVVAPSLIPKKPGDRVKTNRRDAVSLAKLLRVGDLTGVWVPDARHEAMRDLTRARGSAAEDLRRQAPAGDFVPVAARSALSGGQEDVDQNRTWLACEPEARASGATDRLRGDAVGDPPGTRAYRAAGASDPLCGAGVVAGRSGYGVDGDARHRSDLGDDIPGGDR